MSTPLIGVTGYAQHGKDTVARRLSWWGYSRIGFADAVKDLACAVNPIILGTPGNYIRLADLVGIDGWEAAKQRPEVRRFLQELGKGARWFLGEDVWVRALERWMLQEHTPVVVADVRFPDEAAWIHRQSGVLIRVHRPNFDNGVDPSHITERYVPHLPADYELENDDTIHDLDVKVDAVMADLAEGFRPMKEK